MDPQFQPLPTSVMEYRFFQARQTLLQEQQPVPQVAHSESTQPPIAYSHGYPTPPSRLSALSPVQQQQQQAAHRQRIYAAPINLSANPPPVQVPQRPFPAGPVSRPSSSSSQLPTAHPPRQSYPAMMAPSALSGPPHPQPPTNAPRHHPQAPMPSTSQPQLRAPLSAPLSTVLESAWAEYTHTLEARVAQMERGNGAGAAGLRAADGADGAAPAGRAERDARAEGRAAAGHVRCVQAGVRGAGEARRAALDEVQRVNAVALASQRDVERLRRERNGLRARLNAVAQEVTIKPTDPEPETQIRAAQIRATRRAGGWQYPPEVEEAVAAMPISPIDNAPAAASSSAHSRSTQPRGMSPPKRTRKRSRAEYEADTDGTGSGGLELAGYADAGDEGAQRSAPRPRLAPSLGPEFPPALAGGGGGGAAFAFPQLRAMDVKGMNSPVRWFMAVRRKGAGAGLEGGGGGGG
ncbi:hypothetical protein B0H14DRAFT_3900371 [Mycena olivaceomarginata]|nr:hypothetical protein B0H14DRAFT_3900371 [Mycena olivaceomarginata]